MSLRELCNGYLRSCPDWREHPEHANTYMEWEDLRATSTRDTHMTLPTDLAAMRQMAYEAMSEPSLTYPVSIDWTHDPQAPDG